MSINKKNTIKMSKFKENMFRISITKRNTIGLSNSKENARSVSNSKENTPMSSSMENALRPNNFKENAPKMNNSKGIIHKMSKSKTRVWLFILENKFDTFVYVIGCGNKADDAKNSILEKFTALGQGDCDKLKQALFSEGTISMWFDHIKAALPTSPEIDVEKEMAFFI